MRQLTLDVALAPCGLAFQANAAVETLRCARDRVTAVGAPDAATLVASVQLSPARRRAVVSRVGLRAAAG